MTELHDPICDTPAFDIENVYGSPDPHKVIRASAGSGKTYQLTSRYLRLLRHNAAPDSILATTFTRKAAGEILGRVLGTLAQAAHDPAKRRSLADAIGDTRLTDHDCRAMLARLVQSLDRLAISTIDSFFNRIAQGFRYELDLPINPQLVHEHHPLAAQLRAQAIEAMLADDDLPTLLTLLRRLHHDDAARSVTQAIDDIVCAHHDVYRQAPYRPLWSRLQAPDLLDEAQLTGAIDALVEMGPDLPVTNAGTVRKRWKTSYTNDVRHAHAGNWEAFLKGGIPKKIAAEETSFDGCPIDTDWRNAYAPLVHHALSVRIQAVAHQTQAIFDLLHRFDEHYNHLRRQQRLLLFTDLTHKLARLLPSLGDDVLGDVYYRLDGRVTHLLLDEFQDTSIDQWNVLQPIAEEVTANSDGSRSLFCVGDVKQAIYGWRGGCAELFDHVEQLAGPAEDLAVSWRSSQFVLDAVNRVFSGIADNPALQDHQVAAQRWQEVFETHEAARSRPGYVELVTSDTGADASPGASLDTDPQFDTHTGDDPDADNGEAFGSHEAFAAQRVRDLYEAAPEQSIGVLLATNKLVNRMIYELRSLGLTVSGEGGNPVTDSPAVAAVLAAITLADHPGHSAAAFHVFNSPLGDVVGLRSTDRREVARVAVDIRRSLLTRGYAETIARWVRAVAPACHQRNLIRLSQLVELAEQYEPMESLRPGRFVAFVQVTPVEDPSPAPIRVMTIHAAKGLEFDTVVLPQLDRPLAVRTALLTQRDEPTGPIRGVYRCPPQVVRQQIPELEEIYDTFRQAECEEDLCSLYVAMTRAKHALHMIIKPLTRNKDGRIGAKGWSDLSFATIVRHALGDSGHEGFDGNQCLFSDGDRNWVHHLPPRPAAAASVPEPPADPRITLAEPTDATRRNWASVTPSSLHGGGHRRAADLLRLDESESLVTGRVVHAWLQAISFVDDPDGIPDDDHLLQIAAAEGMTARRAAQELPRFRDMLARPAVTTALEKHDAHELWRERSFAVQLDGRLLHGQFDRVVIQRHPDGSPSRATLIDFKTDRVDLPAVDARLDHYRPQLEAYRRALSHMLPLDPARITTLAIFLHLGEVRSI